MSDQNAYTAFQRHLLFFSTPTVPPRLTLLSGVRAAISLGLDFPVAILLTLSLRLMYAPLQYPFSLSPINVEQIPRSKHRTQLSDVRLTKPEYTCSQLLELLASEPRKDFLKYKIDQGHVIGFWAMAANTKTHTVARSDVERFQQGEWEESVAKRRLERNDVLPLWRGGPIVVEWHSWAVRKVLGVRVYKANSKQQ